MTDIEHAMNVSILSRNIGIKLMLEEKTCALLSVAGMLHDIGKIGIPPELLDKRTALTPDEYRIIQWHTTMGYTMLNNMPDQVHRMAAIAALYHHERCDGSGYMGLYDEQIPIPARIVSVADVYDALVSDRPYRKAWKKEKATDYLSDQAGEKLDRQIVDALLAIV